MKKDLEKVDQPTLIVYFCRETGAIVKNPEVKKGTKYTFVNPETGKECVYGTARSIINYFRIKEHSENGQALLELQQEKLKELPEKKSEE